MGRALQAWRPRKREELCSEASDEALSSMDEWVAPNYGRAKAAALGAVAKGAKAVGVCVSIAAESSF